MTFVKLTDLTGNSYFVNSTHIIAMSTKGENTEIYTTTEHVFDAKEPITDIVQQVDKLQVTTH